MIGYKSIDEMNLEECFLFLEKHDESSDCDAIKAQFEKLASNLSLEDSYSFLQHHKAIADNSCYQKVSTRYKKLVKEYQEREERSFNSCSKIKDYQGFIIEYQGYAPAYKAVHIADARNKILKLKKRNRIIAIGSPVLLVLTVLLFGYKPARSLSVENVAFGKEGGDTIIRIETNASADAIELTKPEKDWVEVMLEGKKLIVSAEANPDPDRSCTMVIRAYSTFFGERIGALCKEEVVISQNSGYAINTLDVSSHDFSIGKYGGSKQVNIKTDGVALELTPSDTGWISVNSKSQNHNDQFYHIDDFEINVEKNPGDVRMGKVIVSTGGQPPQEITITQASGLATKKISASPLRIHCNDADGLTDGSYYKVDFSTDGTSWSKSEPDWIEVEEVIGVTGEGYLKVIPTYNDGSYRDGTIYLVSNNGHTTEIEVSQDGGPSNLYASPSTWYPGTGYDSKTISVNNDSHYPLSVSSSDTDWLTASVSGNNVTVSCTSTYSGYKKPRKGTVTVKCRNETCSIVVKQDGYKDCGKCKGDGKCTGGQWVANSFGWGGSVQHSWQEYEVTGSYYDNILGCWLPTYGWVWHYCSQCGGNGKCKECGGEGKVVTQYKSSY